MTLRCYSSSALIVLKIKGEGHRTIAPVPRGPAARIGVHLPFPTMTVLPSTKGQKRHHSLNEQPFCTP
jgi:hypothetical protein